MFLIPGDSPIGLRLPLESIQWVPPEARDPAYERDPLEPREETLDTAVGVGLPNPDESEPATKNGETQTVVQTALCVEPRDGSSTHLYTTVGAFRTLSLAS